MVLSGVGATLREERLRRQFTLEHVSNVTRISARYLEAIENDRPEDLPGTVFTRGFVQQYARFLELPAEELLARLPKVDIEHAALPVPPPKVRRPLWNPRWNLPTMALGVATVLVAAAGGAWFYFDLTPVFVAAARAGVAAARSQQAAKNQQQAVVQTVPQGQAPQAAPGAEGVQAVPEQQVAPGQPAPDPAVAERVIPASSEVQAPSSGAVQVLLRANADAWVQVVADGKKAFTGMLHRNDSREISGNQLVRVMTGNAGGLEISLNGRVLESLGPVGQVRTVRLTADGLAPEIKSPEQTGAGPI